MVHQMKVNRRSRFKQHCNTGRHGVRSRTCYLTGKHVVENWNGLVHTSRKALTFHQIAVTLTGLLSQANCECAFLPRVYGRHCPRETGLASLIFEFPPSVNASHCQARASSPSNFNVFFIPTVKIVWSIPWEAISHGTSWAATPHGTSWEATSHGTSWEDSFLIYLWTLEMSLRRDLNSGSSDYQSDPLTIPLQLSKTHGKPTYWSHWPHGIFTLGYQLISSQPYCALTGSLHTIKLVG